MLDVNYFFHGTRIIEGCGVLNQVGDEAKALNAKKALIVTDTFLSKTEFYKAIKDSLENAGVQAVLGTNVKPNPRAADCDEMAQMAKEEGVDLVIAFGGGSAMDQAKTVAALLTNGKRAVEWGDVELENNIMSLFCIPTTSGTGSEVTFCAVITDEKRHYKMTVGDPVHMIPTLAICDPEVTLNLPKPLTAACGVDALTHAIEAYTVKVHQPLTDALALKSISMISENLVLAYEDGQNREARRNMMIASTMAGMAFISSNVGAVHAIAETVGAWFDTPHGVANSLFLPYVMEYNIPACTNRFVDVSKALGVVRKEGMTDFDYAMAGVEFIKELNRKLNIPTLKDLSEISVDKFEQIAEKSAANILSNDNAKEIGKDEYLEILNKAYMG